MALVDKTITTYTFLDSLRESGIQQLDLYVPLVYKSILKHNASGVCRDDLKAWFAEDYGMSKVYQGVFDTLLRKMKGSCLTLKNGKYEVNISEVIRINQMHEERDITADFDNLLKRIQAYSNDNYQLVFSLEDVQNGVLDLLHSRDGDLIFAQDKVVGVLQKQKNGKTPDKKLRFIISQFVIWSKDNDTNSFVLFVKLAKGHALTSIVTMKDTSSYTGKMKGVTIALDTPLIFNLLGLNYKTNLELERELIDVLKKQEASFVVFQGHYQEVKQSISSAIYLLTTKNYDLNKASRLLRYAIKNHLSPHFLRTKLQQLDAVLEKYNISVIGAPPSELGFQEIDVKKLDSLLAIRYSDDGNPDSLDENTRRIIATDVDVVSYIYRLRGNNVATNLKNCTALLITTNTALAYASKHPGLSDIMHSIPVCLTDVFMSTMLWFNYPDVDADVNEKLLISECYKNITLSDDILQKFYKDVERINAETPLTEEQILDANTSEVVMDLLENKTYNDSNLYTDMTAAEVLETMELKRNKNLKENERKLNNISENAWHKSRKIATCLYSVIWIVLVALFLFLKFIDWKDWKGWNILFNILSILPVLWGLLSWRGWIWPKVNVIDWISKIVYNVLYKDLDVMKE